MNVLVVGGGAREHALVWKLAQSKEIGKIYVAPGNGGTAKIAQNIPIESTDIEGLFTFAQNKNIDLVIVGPDTPLALGIADVFQSKGMKIFGPTKVPAQIESSKAFAKELMRENNIPTAEFCIFKNYNEALDYINKHGAPIVVKASGLAFGKGAYPCKTLPEAEEALSEIMLKLAHQSAGDEVVIEEYIDGEEISLHALCDGKNFAIFPAAQDHKPVFDGNRGPNTGGMGTLAPVPGFDGDFLKSAGEQVISQTLQALTKRGKPFTGCLYPGIKVTSEGLKVLEFNARFGDPEAQSYMRILETDILEIFNACVDGKLSETSLSWHSGFAICVVLASGGYPGEYKKGIPISGIEEAEKISDVVVFHAGTKYANGQYYTSGGRVLSVTAIGQTPKEAYEQAYRAVGCIHFEGMHYRKDIGLKYISR